MIFKKWAVFETNHKTKGIIKTVIIYFFKKLCLIIINWLVDPSNSVTDKKLIINLKIAKTKS